MIQPASVMRFLRAEPPDETPPPPLGSREHVLDILRVARDAARRDDERLLALRPTFVVPAPQLRASVTAYVMGLRREQLPPQTVLILVKALLREAIPSRVDPAAERALTADVVRWCIDAYYDGA